MPNGYMPASNTVEWGTPERLFRALNDLHHFSLDPAATSENAKCEKYFTAEDNGLIQSWEGHTSFCHPPYGR